MLLLLSHQLAVLCLVALSYWRDSSPALPANLSAVYLPIAGATRISASVGGGDSAVLVVVGLVGGATVLFGAGVALARLVVPGRRLVVLGRRLGGGAAVIQFVAGVARA